MNFADTSTSLCKNGILELGTGNPYFIASIYFTFAISYALPLGSSWCPGFVVESQLSVLIITTSSFFVLPLRQCHFSADAAIQVACLSMKTHWFPGETDLVQTKQRSHIFLNG